MDIEIVVDATAVRRWQARIAEHLGALPGVELWISAVGGPSRGATTDLLFRLEGLVYGVAPGHPAELVELAAMPGRRGVGCRPDLVVDLTGVHSGVAPTVRVGCSGASVDDGALSAVLATETPVLTLDLLVGDTERPIERWPVAVMDPHVAVRAVGTVLGRAVHMVQDAVDKIVSSGDPRSLTAERAVPEVARAGRVSSGVRFAGTALANRVTDRIRRHLGEAPNWFVGWRRLGAPASGVPGLAGATYARVPDDGRRFLADPFPVHRDGRDYLFVEEFPYATERGVISVLEILADGSTTPPRVVLETESHLSYPFLVETGADLFMIPESSRRGRVELWRATSFPDRWEPAGVLIEGVDLADATVVRDGGRWYLFAAPRAEWTSNWDAVAVYTATDLFGPWQPLPGNPVLVDVRAARPGGALIRHGGRLVRPVQDCAAGYGAALGWAVVDRLDPGGFAQTLLRRDVPPRPLAGLHTYNRSSRIEVVDAFGPRSVGVVTLPGHAGRPAIANARSSEIDV